MKDAPSDPLNLIWSDASVGKWYEPTDIVRRIPSRFPKSNVRAVPCGGGFFLLLKEAIGGRHDYGGAIKPVFPANAVQADRA
jgi:hypothetical protein